MVKLQTPLTNEHLRAIGKISVNFALLELTMSACIGALMGKECQNLGNIVTAELSFRRLIDLLSSLYRHRVSDPKKIKELEALLKKALQAEEKRNIIIHSSWGSVGTLETIIRLKMTAKFSKGKRRQLQKMSVKDLDDIADSIGQVVIEFLDVLTGRKNL